MTQTINTEVFDKVAALIRAEAEEKKTNAGFSGEWGDGGAGSMLEQLKYYELGMQGKIPAGWMKYIQKLQREAAAASEAAKRAADPEYAEYQRLQKKFGH